MFIKGEGYIVYGAQRIADLCGVSRVTMYKWIKTRGFPAAKAPSGQYMTTKGLIDAWVLTLKGLQDEQRKG